MLHRRAAHAGVCCSVLLLLAAAWPDIVSSPHATRTASHVVVNEDYNLVSFAARVSGFVGESGQVATHRPRSLRIIASGLSRTGTQTLKYSLRSLGYSCYHTEEIVMHGHTGLWLPAAPNSTAGQEALREVADRILDLGYDCVMDDTWPWSARLLRLFPDAKVIHTVRDSPEVWWRSFQKIVQAFLPIAISRPYCWLVSWDFIAIAVRDMFGVSAWNAKNLDIAHPLPWADIATFKPGVLQTMKDEFIAAYKMEEELMAAVTPPGQLLVFNVKQGWGPLCSFLHVGEDCPEGPLPHLNQGGQFDLIRKILLAICYAYPVLPLLPLVLALCMFKLLRVVCRFVGVPGLARAHGKQD